MSPCIPFAGGIVCLPENAVTIMVRGKPWTFEPPRPTACYGPLWLRKDGEPRAQQNVPGYVWDAFDTWWKANRKRAADAAGVEREG